MSNKQMYASHLFALPVEQIRYYDELTPEQLEQCHHYFGISQENNRKYVYAVKKNGGLVWNRELKRPEWESIG